MRKIEIKEVISSSGKTFVVETRWEQKMRSADTSKESTVAASVQHLIFDEPSSLLAYLTGFLNAKPF